MGGLKGFSLGGAKSKFQKEKEKVLSHLKRS
jgi:hypothetical protein